MVVASSEGGGSSSSGTTSTPLGIPSAGPHLQQQQMKPLSGGPAGQQQIEHATHAVLVPLAQPLTAAPALAAAVQTAPAAFSTVSSSQLASSGVPLNTATQQPQAQQRHVVGAGALMTTTSPLNVPGAVKKQLSPVGESIAPPVMMSSSSGAPSLTAAPAAASSASGGGGGSALAGDKTSASTPHRSSAFSYPPATAAGTAGVQPQQQQSAVPGPAASSR